MLFLSFSYLMANISGNYQLAYATKVTGKPLARWNSE